MEKKENTGLSAEEKYKDIIHLPHPTSPTRPRMSREARAAQFGSFDALTGYGAAVAETARITETEQELTEEKKAMIDEILRGISDTEEGAVTVTVTYFRPDERKEGGAYMTKTGAVKRIDTYQRRLILMDGTTIPVDKIHHLFREG